MGLLQENHSVIVPQSKVPEAYLHTEKKLMSLTQKVRQWMTHLKKVSEKWPN
jgi:hypothetical protein